MTKHWLIIVIGIACGLIIGILTPSIDLGASDNSTTIQANSSESSSAPISTAPE